MATQVEGVGLFAELYALHRAATLHAELLKTDVFILSVVQAWLIGEGCVCNNILRLHAVAVRDGQA